MILKKLALAAVVTAVGLIAVTAAFAASPLTNPGFETGDFTGWSADSDGPGAWDTTTTGEAFCGGTTNAPLEGTTAALWDMDGPSEGALWQEFTVPASESISFAFAYDNEAGEWAQGDDPWDLEAFDNEWLRIDVIESETNLGTFDPTDIVATGFDSQAGEQPLTQGWRTVSVSLPGRAGDTLVLRVITANNLSCMPVWFDTADPAAQDSRLGYCSVAGNTDGNGKAIAPGTFVDLSVGQPSTDAHYKGAIPAIYYQGRGLSCDNMPGYTKTTELVGYSGHGSSGPYSYYTKN